MFRASIGYNSNATTFLVPTLFSDLNGSLNIICIVPLTIQDHLPVTHTKALFNRLMVPVKQEN